MRLLKNCLLVVCLLIAGTVSGFAQTAEEIVTKHLTAVGGADNWRKINTIKMTGGMSVQGTEIKVVLTTVNEKAMRMDMDMAGMPNYMILTNTQGWSYFPIQGQTKPEAMTAEQVKGSQGQLNVRGELVDYKAKGSKVDFAGKEDIDGNETLKLKFTDKDGKEKMMYFDAKSYYLVRKTEKVTTQDGEMDLTTDFSNYQKLPEGIVVAMTVESPMGAINMSKIEVNTKVDEGIFKPGS